MVSIIDVISLHNSLRSSFGDPAVDLLSYMAWSEAPNFKYEQAYKDLFNRVEHATPGLSYYPYEATIFDKRFEMLRNNNKLYRLAIKQHPTLEDVTEFSYEAATYALLFPVKCFLLDYPEMAAKYRGFVPFGKPVKKFYNANKYGTEIKGTPTFKDHNILQEHTVSMALSSGFTLIWINSVMYLGGKELLNGIADPVED